jgi:hypothetical protein
MKQLSSYLLEQINEASVSLPGDVDQKMNGYFKIIAPEIKNFEAAAKSTFKVFNTTVNGTRVVRWYTCWPKRPYKAWKAELEKFMNNPGKWTYEGIQVYSLGRGGSKSMEKFVITDGDVKYTIAFQANFKDIEGNTDVSLYIDYPVMVSAEELKFTPNTSDKTKDIAGRVIEVGDSVAYCSRTVSGNNPMPVGVVTEVTTKQITVFDKINNNLVKIPGYKCCMIEL